MMRRLGSNLFQTWSQCLLVEVVAVATMSAWPEEVVQYEGNSIPTVSPKVPYEVATEVSRGGVMVHDMV